MYSCPCELVAGCGVGVSPGLVQDVMSPCGWKGAGATLHTCSIKMMAQKLNFLFCALTQAVTHPVIHLLFVEIVE